MLLQTPTSGSFVNELAADGLHASTRCQTSGYGRSRRWQEHRPYSESTEQPGTFFGIQASNLLEPPLLIAVPLVTLHGRILSVVSGLCNLTQCLRLY